MAIEVRLGLVPPVTVMAAELVKAPDLAAIVAAPLATPVTTPAVLTVAIFESEEVQVAEELRSLVVPSEYVPIAWTVTVDAAAMEAALGVTERPLREAETGCPPEPGCPLPELRLLVPTPLQPARSRQNKGIQILCRTYFLRKFSGA